MTREEYDCRAEELKEQKRSLVEELRSEIEGIRWDIRNDVTEENTAAEIEAEIQNNLDYYRRFVETLEDLAGRLEDLTILEDDLGCEEIEEDDEKNE